MAVDRVALVDTGPGQRRMGSPSFIPDSRWFEPQEVAFTRSSRIHPERGRHYRPWGRTREYEENRSASRSSSLPTIRCRSVPPS